MTNQFKQQKNIVKHWFIGFQGRCENKVKPQQSFYNAPCNVKKDSVF